MTTQIDQTGKRAGRAGGTLRRPLAPYLAPLFAILFVAVALAVVHEITAHVHLRDILAAARGTPPHLIALAVSYTVLSYVAMAAYDIVSTRALHMTQVPVRVAAFAGAVSYAVANVVGFNFISSGSVRFRVYSRIGLEASDSARIVAVSAFGIWVGMAVMFGLALAAEPVNIPGVFELPPSVSRFIGLAILAAGAALLVWLAAGRRRFPLFGWHLELPPMRYALVQIAIALVDFSTAAAVLYVLLPSDIGVSFLAFLPLFLIAIVVGTASHAPGGLGVLEATILFGLGAGNRPEVIAALLTFRVVYYLLPFAAALLALLPFELHHMEVKASVTAGRLFRFSRPVVARVLAAIVFAGGLVLLLSGSNPDYDRRLQTLSEFTPLPFAEASHMLASISGLFLIVLARGLYMRMALAQRVAIGFLLAGAVFTLVKGLNYEEAAFLIAIAALLFVYRSAFYRRGDWRQFRLGPQWLALVIITIACITLVGFLAYRHVEYSADLWWQFAWKGDAPRFLRTTLALAIVTGALTLDALINRPAVKAAGQRSVPGAVRRILADCPETQPQVALLGDKNFLLSEEEDAFLMYGVSGRSWVTMGGPVGNPDKAQTLIWHYAEMIDRAGGRAVFYGLKPDAIAMYLDFGFSILKFGEVARVDLDVFTMEGRQRKDLRYALSRSKRDGLEFSVIPRDQLDTVMPRLRKISNEWLEGKHGSEKRFSLGRFDEAYLSEFDIAVMRKDGEIVAFANIWRGAGRHEISVDLMRYSRDRPSLLMEAFFVHLILYGKADGYKWFNLGAAPLAGLIDHPLASAWNRIGVLIYRHGEEFFNFEGLRAFKEKFDPVWTPQYIACPGGFALPQILFEISTLISGSPAKMGRFFAFLR
ncbi:bifunctional lysylphosphatidylglycerol flippase/synthetase MprF [Oricola nitratireducens]|uniref:bifunctional lysylphosphatidylglycerol flippase/synthetase MprF n=1 Tax=Oricola nitratireducens TaxID=2775868 RepID=UPI0018679C8A